MADTALRLLVQASGSEALRLSAGQLKVRGVPFKVERMFEHRPPDASFGMAATDWFLAVAEPVETSPWDAAHDGVIDGFGMGLTPGFSYAEPDIVHEWPSPYTGEVGLAAHATAPPCQFRSQDTFWPAAPSFTWFLEEEFFGLRSARNRVDHSHIRIGHIDTGYSEHAVKPKNLNTGLQWSFVEGRADAHDPGIDGVLNQPGHGTGTLGILAGNTLHGLIETLQNTGESLGGAPNAEIVPIRVADSVLHFHTSALAPGIRLRHSPWRRYVEALRRRVSNSPWQKSRGPRYGQTGPDSRRHNVTTQRRNNVTTQRRNNVTTRRRDDETMRIHWEESATTKTVPFRRNPLGAGGAPTFQTEAAGAPQALSGIVNTGHDGKTAPAASVSNLGARSSLRACNPKTTARGPRDFCHGLLSMGDVPSKVWADAVNRAYDAGVVIVTAAGNNYSGGIIASLVYPARFNRVIAACGIIADGSPYYRFGKFKHMQGNFGPPSRMKTAVGAYTSNMPWAHRLSPGIPRSISAPRSLPSERLHTFGGEPPVADG